MGSGYSGRDRYGGETTCDVRILSISTGTRVRVRAAGNTKKRNGKAGNGAEAGEKGGDEERLKFWRIYVHTAQSSDIGYEHASTNKNYSC